jgi:5'(3')-deoxyribonucleotidase
MYKPPRRIAVDLDEVLFPLLKPMMKYHKVKDPLTMRYPYKFAEVFGVTPERAQSMLYEYYETPEFENQRPVMGARHNVDAISQNVDTMYIVTGRQEFLRDKTEKWVQTHFPDVFNDIIFTNSYTPDEVRKADVCRALNADLLIDDLIDTCRDCKELKINSINYIGIPVYPWCTPERSEIFKAASWADIYMRII